MNVLLLDGDPDLATMLGAALEARHDRIWYAATARDAELILAHAQPDVIILEVLLPDRNGLLLCAELSGRLDVPIIIGSATRRKDDAALAFKLGASDFIRKPFSADELQVRMDAAVQRRAAAHPSTGTSPGRLERIGRLVIDHAQRWATLGGRPLHLTPTEYLLLCTLAERPGQVLSHEALADRLWGTHTPGIIQSLGVHMRHLRAKLAAAGPAPRVATRRGFGYALVADAPPDWPAEHNAGAPPPDPRV